jgi:hypothetical protein
MVAPDHFGASTGSDVRRARRRRDLGVGAAVVLAATALAQGPAYRESLHQRHWEDRRFFVHNHANITTVGECFTRPAAWPGLYRPLTTNCYYLLGRTLWQNRIETYHAVNLAFYYANGVLLVWLCLDWMAAPWAWLAGALFVSRLAHHQVVTHSVEFQSLASVLFSLLALKLFLAGRRAERPALEAAALPVGVLAFLSKETAVVWPAIALLHGGLFDRRSAARRYLPPVLVAGAWLVLLALVIRPRVTPEPTGFAYDLSAAVVGRYAAYLLVFLNPFTLGLPRDADMPPAVLRLVASGAVRLAFSALVAVEAAALWRWRRRAPEVSAGRLAAFGWGWFLVAAAPYVVLEDRLFMRYGYFPHAGLAVALSAAAAALARRIASLDLLGSRKRRRVAPDGSAAGPPAPDA